MNLKVSGKVQGVFFRAATKERADKLNIKGIVRNEPNGDVYIEAEGESEDVDHFVAWCKKGPAHAQVMTIVIEEAVKKGYVEFTILR